MNVPIKTAYWFSLTGSPKMEMIEKDGKIYISLDDAASVVNSFRFKLIRMGLHQLSGLKPQGIVELLEVLMRQFKILSNLKRESKSEVKL